MSPTLLAPEPGAETPLPSPRRRMRWRLGLYLVFLTCLAWPLYQAFHIFLSSNFHEVLPGQVFRSAQQRPEPLKEMIRRHGIKTVINLRGLCNGHPWYMDQCEAVQDLGINQEDLSFSAHRMPSAPELARLIEVLDNTEYPILLHCRQGADRTGLAAVVVRFLYTEDTLEQALTHMSYRYGHLPVGKTLYLDRFFELYTHWLRTTGIEHSSAHFRLWATREYRGGWCQHAIESVVPLQAKARRGEPVGYRVRLRNVSDHVWQFKAHELAGVHVGVEVLGPDNSLVRLVRAGLFEKEVPPGDTLEVTVVLPPFALPGRYRMRLDMIDEEHCWFQQAGAEAREEEILVHE